MVEARGLSTFNSEIGEFESAQEVVIWEKDSYEFFSGNEVLDEMGSDKIEKYLANKPFPACEKYTAEAFMEDVLNCNGSSFIIPTTQADVVKYVVDFINETCN